MQLMWRVQRPKQLAVLEHAHGTSLATSPPLYQLVHAGTCHPPPYCPFETQVAVGDKYGHVPCGINVFLL